ncbi:S9 family peptidase [Rhizomonospora bruguierae]|uniref:S9 family peptidase n=1 Tax=Rhizomonospora bruguierae TaxID=1581705 RepID=UPI001BCD3DB3|nr:prolyl oligopeptidase family serine peptidase [Micromonospora sp. NBRC 107566]
MEYPELAAATGRFTRGAARRVRVGADGARVVFLRSTGPVDPVERLWVFDVATGTERLVADPTDLGALPDRPNADPVEAGAGGLGGGAASITAYATDPGATVAAFTLDGALFRADLVSGEVTRLPAAGPAIDPRPDPTGRRIGYVTGDSLHVVHPDGTDALLAGETGSPGRPSYVTWGLSDPQTAADFGRRRGYWWSPDGETILAARVDAARVPRLYLADPADPAAEPRSVPYPGAGATTPRPSLALLDLDGGWVDVHWDRETYPYLAAVRWADAAPLITVLRRPQQHGLVLAVDPRTGETQVHAELADPRWVEPIPGTPRHLPDGRVLVGGELAHDGYDARCLFADGTLLTPPTLYVRRVVGRLGTGRGMDLLLEGSEGEPSEQHLYRVHGALGGGHEARRITTGAGWHRGAAGGDTLVVGSASLDAPGTEWTVWRGGAEVGRLGARTATTPYAPRPVLERVTDRRLPTGVLYPRQHVAGRRLPVLLDIHGAPAAPQQVVAARSGWLDRQWWADAGFAVVVVDNRGTRGVAPSFEKVVHRRLADVILADLTDALAALADKHADLDLARVAVRGQGFGGWLAALAALRRPDLFRCAVARSPIADWSRYRAAYAERHLGPPDDAGEVYAHHNLLDLAAEPPARPAEARPLLLVHGLADADVLPEHTLRLSAALLAAGRPHSVLPLPGAGHTEVAEAAGGLLRAELAFIQAALTRDADT